MGSGGFVRLGGSIVSAMTTFANPAALLDAVGTDLGVTDWL